jgi:hypothetical protein
MLFKLVKEFGKLTGCESNTLVGSTIIDTNLILLFICKSATSEAGVSASSVKLIVGVGSEDGTI